MKDYYDMLGLDRNLSEEDLYKEINEKIAKCDERLESAVDEERGKLLTEKLSFKEFRSILNHYGSKKRYDRALGLSGKKEVMKKKMKVMVNSEKMSKVKRFVVVGSLVAASVASVVWVDSLDLQETDIPVYSGEMLGEVMQEGDLSRWNILSDEMFLKSKNEVFTDDYSLDVIYPKKREEEMSDFSEKRGDEKLEKSIYGPQYVSFPYVVQEGDTYQKLYKEYGAERVVSDEFTDELSLLEGKVVTIYTKDEKVAKEMNNYYLRNNPQSAIYDIYIAQEGDTVISVAEAFDIEPQDILDSNSSVVSAFDPLKPGEEIRIPRFEYDKDMNVGLR